VQPAAHDTVLALHIVTGALGLLLGPLAIRAERQPPYRSLAGAVYFWAAVAVAMTALALVATDAAALWWLAPLALLTAALAALGHYAPRRSGPRWIRAYAHGQGGSYVALVTATLVVSLDGPAMIAACAAPTLFGLPLIERRVQRLTARDEGPVTDRARARPRYGATACKGVLNRRSRGS
jgi:hypothetical protein